MDEMGGQSSDAQEMVASWRHVLLIGAATAILAAAWCWAIAQQGEYDGVARRRAQAAAPDQAVATMAVVERLLAGGPLPEDSAAVIAAHGWLPNAMIMRDEATGKVAIALGKGGRFRIEADGPARDAARVTVTAAPRDLCVVLASARRPAGPDWPVSVNGQPLGAAPSLERAAAECASFPDGAAANDLTWRVTRSRPIAAADGPH